MTAAVSAQDQIAAFLADAIPYTTTQCFFSMCSSVATPIKKLLFQCISKKQSQ